eukprot:5043690-Prymnesium_polylepis.1
MGLRTSSPDGTPSDWNNSLPFARRPTKPIVTFWNRLGHSGAGASGCTRDKTLMTPHSASHELFFGSGRALGDINRGLGTSYNPSTTLLIEVNFLTFRRHHPKMTIFQVELRELASTQHDSLAERSLNLTFTSNFNYGEARTSNLKIDPAFAASTLWHPRTRRAS